MWQNKQINLKILVNLFLIALQLIAGTKGLQEKGTNGKPLAKAATFHFPEYAYKETSKNVGHYIRKRNIKY